MASKRCSSIKLLSLTFVSKSISKSLLIKIVNHPRNFLSKELKLDIFLGTTEAVGTDLLGPRDQYPG